EIDHARTGLEQAVFVVELDQLIGRARAEAFLLRLGYVRVVELALEPTRRGDLAPARGLDARLEAAFAIALAGHQRVLRPKVPSALMRPTRMPSRRPRSATRRRRAGKASRIASRMAQPASTRSARSAPMQGCAARSANESERMVSTTSETSL